MREDAYDDSRIFDRGDDLHAPATVRAVFDVDVEDPLEQTRLTQARRRARRVFYSMISCTVCTRNDRGAQPGIGREYPMEADQMQARPRHQRGQTLRQLQRRHHDMRGAVAVGTLQLQHNILR